MSPDQMSDMSARIHLGKSECGGRHFVLLRKDMPVFSRIKPDPISLKHKCVSAIKSSGSNVWPSLFVYAWSLRCWHGHETIYNSPQVCFRLHTQRYWASVTGQELTVVPPEIVYPCAEVNRCHNKMLRYRMTSDAPHFLISLPHRCVTYARRFPVEQPWRKKIVKLRKDY